MGITVRWTGSRGCCRTLTSRHSNEGRINVALTSSRRYYKSESPSSPQIPPQRVSSTHETCIIGYLTLGGSIDLQWLEALR